MGARGDERDPAVHAFHGDRQPGRLTDLRGERLVLRPSGARPLEPYRIHEGVQHPVPVMLRDIFRAQEHLAAQRGRALVRLDLPEARVLVALIAETIMGEHTALDKEGGRFLLHLKAVDKLF